MSQSRGHVPGRLLPERRTGPRHSAYQALSEHVHGGAGLPQGLLGQGLRLASGASSGGLAHVSVALLWFQGGRCRRLPRGRKGPLIIGHGLELRERKGSCRAPRGSHVYTAGLPLCKTAAASDQNNSHDRMQLKT